VKIGEKPPALMETKLFSLEETKKVSEISSPAATELLTPGKAEKPVTLTAGLPGAATISGKTEKKAKRKSLF